MKKHACLLKNMGAALADRFTGSSRPQVVSCELDFILDNESSSSAVALYDEAESLREAGRTTEARQLYARVISLSESCGLTILVALATNQLAFCHLHSADEAGELLQDALTAAQKVMIEASEALMERRATPAVARPMLNPLIQLVELVESNVEEVELLDRSRLMKVRRDFVENLLGEGERDRAVFYAREAVKEATETFGLTHWWTGVMYVRLTQALVVTECYEDALAVAGVAAAILNEWCLEESASPLHSEYGFLRALRSQALNPLP